MPFLKQSARSLIVWFLCACAAGGAAAQTPAKPGHFFNDYAGVVSRDVADALNERLAAAERRTSNQILVAIYPRLPDGQALEDYALVQFPRTCCVKAGPVVSLAMEPPLFVRPLTAEERQQLHAGLHARDAFTLRRCQILLASAQGQRPAQIAAALGCATQTVRNTLHAFERQGPDCVARRSSRPHSAHRLLDAPRAERLRELLHQSPRAFGYAQSHWTLPLAAEVCHRQGLSDRVLSQETVRQAIQRLGLGWKRAKQWITSPDPAYSRKKKPGRGC